MGGRFGRGEERDGAEARWNLALTSAGCAQKATWPAKPSRPGRRASTLMAADCESEHHHHPRRTLELLHAHGPTEHPTLCPPAPSPSAASAGTVQRLLATRPSFTVRCRPWMRGPTHTPSLPQQRPLTPLQHDTHSAAWSHGARHQRPRRPPGRAQRPRGRRPPSPRRRQPQEAEATREAGREAGRRE